MDKSSKSETYRLLLHLSNKIDVRRRNKCFVL